MFRFFFADIMKGMRAMKAMILMKARGRPPYGAIRGYYRNHVTPQQVELGIGVWQPQSDSTLIQ